MKETIFHFNKDYYETIRSTTEQAIGYAMEHRQELLEKAISNTVTIRYSRLVSGLGPWCPFYLNREKDAQAALFDTPKRFKNGEYTAYHLDREGNLVLLRNYLQQELDSDYILFEKDGIHYAVLFSNSGYKKYFTTYRFAFKDGMPQDSAMMNYLCLWGEHIDRYDNGGNGSFVCSSFTYPVPNPQSGGQPGYEMRRVRFIVEKGLLVDHKEELKPTFSSDLTSA